MEYLLVLTMCSVSVILHARLNDWSLNETIRNKNSFTISEVGMNITIQSQVMTMHMVIYKSIYYIRANTINKAPINKLSAAKAPKTQRVEHTENSRKSREFLIVSNKGITSASANIFGYISSFAKVFISV